MDITAPAHPAQKWFSWVSTCRARSLSSRHSLSNGGSFSKSGLAEMEGCIARPALWKLLTVKHAMRTLVELLRNEAEETAGQQRQ